MSSLAEEYQKEQERLRELISQYKAIGQAGSWGLIIISNILKRADHASASHDTVAMIRSFNEMKGCQ